MTGPSGQHIPVALLGLDIGGTKIAAGLVSPGGEVLVRRQVATPADAGADQVLAAAADLGDVLLAEAETLGVGVPAAGVGAAGVVDVASGTIISATGTLPGWAGTRLGPVLSTRWALPVSVDNDVNVTAAAEVTVGGSPTAGLILVVAVGTGIGGAIVRDGTVDRGRTGAAGDLSHLPVDQGRDARPCGCGGQGHLEAYVSGPGMIDRYVRSTGIDVTTLQEVGSRAEGGEPAAREVITESAQVLGSTLGGLANLLDPAGIVVCGGVTGLHAGYWQTVRHAFAATALDGPASVKLTTGRLGRDAGVIGAGMAATARVRP